MGYLKNLEILDLANNSFEKIPSAIIRLNNIKLFHLFNGESMTEINISGGWPLLMCTNKIDYYKQQELLKIKKW